MTTDNNRPYNTTNRDAIADVMVSDMVSWLRRNGKRLCLAQNGQIRFHWDKDCPTVKVSYGNSEDITRGTI